VEELARQQVGVADAGAVAVTVGVADECHRISSCAGKKKQWICNSSCNHADRPRNILTRAATVIKRAPDFRLGAVRDARACQAPAIAATALVQARYGGC